MDSYEPTAFLQSLLEDHYSPCEHLREATCKFSTANLISKLQPMVPGFKLSAEALIPILDDLGFGLADNGAVEFVWLLRERA